MSVMVSFVAGNLTVCSKYVHASNNENKSAALLALCEGNLLVVSGFPSQRARYAESVFMACRQHTYWNTSVAQSELYASIAG